MAGYWCSNDFIFHAVVSLSCFTSVAYSSHSSCKPPKSTTKIVSAQRLSCLRTTCLWSCDSERFTVVSAKCPQATAFACPPLSNVASLFNYRPFSKLDNRRRGGVASERCCARWLDWSARGLEAVPSECRAGSNTAIQSVRTAAFRGVLFNCSVYRSNFTSLPAFHPLTH